MQLDCVVSGGPMSKQRHSQGQHGGKNIADAFGVGPGCGIYGIITWFNHLCGSLQKETIRNTYLLFLVAGTRFGVYLE